jgi:gamma-glutamylcyclotransferase (GGCT)/AIG2-like uncharacterized protein YtfP
MIDKTKFLYDNYRIGRSSKRIDKETFEYFWNTFENYLDLSIPPTEGRVTYRDRFKKLESNLKESYVHEIVYHRIYRSKYTRNLAELKPLIFREETGNSSSHAAFTSDYLRFAQDQTPKQPVARLLNLLYDVRCNAAHGQKILPEEWEDMRKRNEIVFSLTIPVLALVDEILITIFVALGIFSYGTLSEATMHHFKESVELMENLKIKGQLYDLGSFPAWRYDMDGWVHGTVIRAPLESCLTHLDFCDEIEGKQFERRLVLAYNDNDQPEHIVWAYHYRSQPKGVAKIDDGIWKAQNK